MADCCKRIGASTRNCDKTYNAHNLLVAVQSGSVSYTLSFVLSHLEPFEYPFGIRFINIEMPKKQ